MRALLMLVMAFALAVPAAVVLEKAPGAAAWSGIAVDLEHPSYAAKGARVQCTLTIAGGPAGDVGGNYSYKVEIQGSNTTGSSVTPQAGTSESGVFKLNITMPRSAPQTIKIVVNATSKEWRTKVAVSTEVTFQMKVVDPILIRAEVYNTGPVDARNVTARFYADGVLLTTQIFNVSAGSSSKLSYNWTFASIKSGKHVVTVYVDDPSRVVEFSDGNNVFSQTIYVGKQSNPAGVVLVVGIIIMSVLVALMYIAKPPRRSKKT